VTTKEAYHCNKESGREETKEETEELNGRK
jgi:hypothetical protein